MKATPLLLIALGLAVCFRSNVWNIGAEGPVRHRRDLRRRHGHEQPARDRALVRGSWCCWHGVVGGMVWAGIVALLRDRFNASEILVSLMMVYIADMVLGYLVYGPWKDPAGCNFPQTITFLKSTQMPRLVEGFRVNIGLPIALAAVAGFWLLFRTYAGFQLQVDGLCAGGGALCRLLLAQGAVDGAAAVGRHGGPGRCASRWPGRSASSSPHVPAGYGFAAIIVAFVGRLHPVGAIFAAILMSMFYIGGELAQSRLGLPKSLTGVFQGLLAVHAAGLRHADPLPRALEAGAYAGAQAGGRCPDQGGLT